MNVDGKPPGGLASGSFGSSRGSVLSPFEPQNGHSTQVIVMNALDVLVDKFNNLQAALGQERHEHMETDFEYA